MKIERLKNLIETMFDGIQQHFSKILDASTYQRVLGGAKAGLQSSYNGKGLGYKIEPNFPLRFTISERPIMKSYVDVFCDMQWEGDDIPIPMRQDIKMRLWTLDQRYAYREGIDAEEMKINFEKNSNKGRVISRFHFDKVNHEGNNISEEYHPIYHLQVGGKPNEDEYCWHPKSFDIPRIPHHPMDLFLTCQLVAKNFFPKQYQKIANDKQFVGLIRSMQNYFWYDYYKSCLEFISNGESLLDKLASS